MLRKIFLLLFFLIIFVFPLRVAAIYDPLSVPNNRFGIHILATNELDKAAELVNSSGGDWGYITIPIRANERDLTKWTDFMNHSREKHLIPILRIASFPVGDHWMAPNEWDLVDFANFLDSLPWPSGNRYVIVYNEPNHDSEWGGFVYPEEYARVLDRAIDIFHKKNRDFFIISGGFDSSAPNGANSMDEYEYMRRMNLTIPDIFKKSDGFSSHAYGNPGFSSYPSIYSPVSVANYRFEENYLSSLGVDKPKLFITEAGFRSDLLGEVQTDNYFQIAYEDIWTDENIVAITPFLLSANAGPFVPFSFTDSAGNFKTFAKSIKDMPKISGKPIIVAPKENQNPNTALGKVSLSVPSVIGNQNWDLITLFEEMRSNLTKLFHLKI